MSSGVHGAPCGCPACLRVALESHYLNDPPSLRGQCPYRGGARVVHRATRCGPKCNPGAETFVAATTFRAVSCHRCIEIARRERAVGLAILDAFEAA